MEPAFYEHYARLDQTHWWFIGRRAIVLRALGQATGPAPGVLLDFGCGTGGILQHLTRFGAVRGVDGDAQAVGFARGRGHDVQHVPDGEPLPFGDETFDVVTALDVLEHIEDDGAALRELHRVLRPGGLLLVTVPAFPLLWGDQDEISHHHRRYRARQLTTRITAAGLRLDHVSYFNSLLFPPIAVLRIVRRLLRPPSAEKTDFDMGSPYMNTLLARLFAAEAGVVTRRSVPFGVSLLSVARRPVPA